MLNSLFSAKKKYSRTRNIDTRHVTFPPRGLALGLRVLPAVSGPEAAEPPSPLPRPPVASGSCEWAVFGNRWGRDWLRWGQTGWGAPSPETCALLPEGPLDAEARETLCAGGGRAGAMFLQSRDTTGFGGHHRQGEAWHQSPPEAVARAGPADTLIPDRGLPPGRERAWSFIRATGTNTPARGGGGGSLASAPDWPAELTSPGSPTQDHGLGLCPVPGPGHLQGPLHTSSQGLVRPSPALAAMPASVHTSRPHPPRLACAAPAGPTLPACAVPCGRLQLQPTAQPVPGSSTCFCRLGGGVGTCYRQPPSPQRPRRPCPGPPKAADIREDLCPR